MSFQKRFLLPVLFAAASCLLLAQADRGTIEGLITDPTGSPVPGVKVRIVRTQTQDTLDLTTNDAGRYFAPNLPVGTYRAVAEKEGFRSARVEGIEIQSQASVRADIALTLGSITENVEVTAEASLLDASTPTISTSLSTRFIEQIPLISSGNERYIQNLVNLLPGVTRQSVQYIRINGSGIGNTQVYMDGLPGGVAGWTGSIGESSPAVESVGEFSVVSNSFNAEYGRTGTWFTNLVFRSGTNQFHGKLFDFFSHSNLNSRSFLQGTVPITHQNEGGAVIGGPVYIPKVYNGRNRTFFFYGQQLFYKLAGASGTPITIPTLAFRNGDFSQFAGSTGGIIPIFDPDSSRPDGNGGFVRTQFPNNQIPDSLISGPARKILALMPAPDVANAQINNFYARSASNPKLNNFIETIKIDHSFSDKHKLSILYRDQNTPQISTCTGYGLASPLEGCQNPKLLHTRNPRINYDWIIRPNLLNHFTLGADRYFNLYSNSTYGQGWNQKLGITGLPWDPGSIPWIQFTGGTDVPSSISNQYHGIVPTGRYALNENLTWVAGRHSLKFGGTYGREYENSENVNNANGHFFFNNLSTSQPGDAANSAKWGSSFASFLLGGIYSAQTSSGAAYGWRVRYGAVFAQDEWRMTQKLTLSYGLRWELYPAAFESHDRYSIFDPTVPNPGADGRLGALIFAGTGQGRSGTHTFADGWYRGFAPRLGLAYELTPKTVMRASAGIYYAPGTSAQITQFGFASSPNYVSADGFTPVYNWNKGSFPASPLPPFIDPSFQNGQPVGTFQHDGMRAPQILTWTYSIQRQLTQNTVLDLTYIGSHSTHLSTGQNSPLTNLNVLDPKYLSLGALLTQPYDSSAAKAIGITAPFASFGRQVNHTAGQALKPYPQYMDITENYGPHFVARFNTLQMKVTKRYSSGLTLLAHYTWMKNLTNDDEGPANQSPYEAVQNPLDRRGEMAVSSDGHPGAFVATASFELPFGAGKQYLNSGLLGRVAGGWEIVFTGAYSSGNALTVTTSNNLASLGYPNLRANLVGGQPIHLQTNSGSFNWTRDHWLNPAAFSVPPPFTLGNTARVLDYARGPMQKTESLSVGKRTHINDKLSVMLRLESQNPFNFHRWGDPVTSLSDANFGRILGATPGRTVQLYLGLEF
jgi:hypothetical protein